MAFIHEDQILRLTEGLVKELFARCSARSSAFPSPG